MKDNIFDSIIPKQYRLSKTYRYILFFLAAYFLANAVFFDVAVPFFVPFWAVIRKKYPKMQTVTLAGGLIGALTLNFGQFIILIIQFIIFQLIQKQKIFWMPLALQVTLSTFITQLLWQTTFYQQWPTLELWAAISLEVVLALLMTLLIESAVSINPNQSSDETETEKKLALFIIVATILTGMSTVQWGVFNLSIFTFHLLICYLTRQTSMTNTVIAATTVGVIQAVANLAFTGMMSLVVLTAVATTLCKRFGKVGIAIVSVVPSFFYFMYDSTLPLDPVYFVSIFMACGVFMLLPTPENNLIKENDDTDMADQKKQELVLQQMTQFQQFIYFMSNTIIESTQPTKNTETETVLQNVPYEICKGCFRNKICWVQNHAEMTNLLQGWHSVKGMNQPVKLIQTEEQINRKCIKAKALIEEMEISTIEKRIESQYFHGKKMLAMQLHDFSAHLDKLINDMKHQVTEQQNQEQQLLYLFREQEFDCETIRIERTQTGATKVTLELFLQEPLTNNQQKQIIDLLNSFFEENFYIENTNLEVKHSLPAVVMAQSAPRFELDYDVYSKSKWQGIVSGDAHSVFQLNQGYYGILLSDGMGHAKNARDESEQIIYWMHQFLRFQLQVDTAMQTMHYLLSLKNNTDMYATLDMALIDLHMGRMYSWKAGGMSTYIVRGQKIFKVESYAPPIGVMPQFYVEMNEQELKSNDMIFIVSDGLFSHTGTWHEQETYFMQLISEYVARELPSSALLVELMERYRQRFSLSDDCTIIFLKVKHPQPNWSTVAPKETVKI